MTPAWVPPAVVFFSLLVLLVSSQVFWFRCARSLVRARQKRWQRWLVGIPLYGWFLLLGAMFVFIPLRWLVLSLSEAPILLSLFTVFRQPPLVIAVGLWMTASLFSFVLIKLVQGSGWLFAWLRPLVRAPRARLREQVADGPDGVSPERRYFLETLTYAAGAVPFVMVGYGFLIGRQDYRVQEVTVPIANLPEGLDGLRLVQLTDVHASAYMPVEEIRRVVGLANELGADLVFHTGDYITSRGDPLPEAIGELSRVEGRLGCFGCLGNHEDYADVTDAATELFARQGVRILRGQNAELEIRGAKLNLIGVDYQRHTRGPGPELSKPDWLVGVERLVRPEAFNLLLCHNPNPFVRAAELGIELTLAGHTHGGQVQVEILNTRWSPPLFFTPFVSGLFERPFPMHEAQSTKHAFLYVSRGIGTIAAPVRLNAPPEITLLTLRRA